MTVHSDTLLHPIPQIPTRLETMRCIGFFKTASKKVIKRLKGQGILTRTKGTGVVGSFKLVKEISNPQKAAGKPKVARKPKRS